MSALTPSPESGHQTRQGGMSALGQKRTSLAYSITSSAMESTSTRVVNPSVRAVLRLQLELGQLQNR